MSIQLFKNSKPISKKLIVPTITAGLRELGLSKGRINKILKEEGKYTFTRGKRKGQEVIYKKINKYKMYILDTPNGKTSIKANSATEALKKFGLSPYARKKLISNGEFDYVRGIHKGWKIRNQDIPESPILNDRIKRGNIKIKKVNKRITQFKIKKNIRSAADKTYENGKSTKVFVNGMIKPKDIGKVIHLAQTKNANSERLLVAVIHMLATDGSKDKNGDIKAIDLTIVMKGESWATRIDEIHGAKPDVGGSDEEIAKIYANIEYIEFYDAEDYLINAHPKMNGKQVMGHFMKNLIVNNNKLNRKTRQGSFFPFFNLNPKIDLTRQQIYTEDNYNVNECKINCFMFAMKNSNVLTVDELDDMRISFIKRNTTIKDVKDIAKKYNLHFIVNQKYDINTKTYHINKNGDRIIKLGLINNHWFINEKLDGGYSAFINHFDKLILCKPGQNKYISNRGGRWLKDSTMKEITAFRAINDMLKLRQFKSFTSEDLEKVGRFKPSDKLEKLGHENYNFKPVYYTEKLPGFKSGKKFIKPNIIYADFETTTDGLFKAFSVSASNKNATSKFSYYGKDCAKKLLDWVPNYSYVFFHNLTFDSNFIVRDLTGVTSMMRNGTQIKRMSANYGKKRLLFIDSYLYIPAALSSFGSYFPNVINSDNSKEIFPYDWFDEKRTFDNVENVPIEEVLEFIKPEDREEFKNNKLNKFGFNKRAYTKYYCDRDVEVLRLGMNEFIRGMKAITNMTDEEFNKYNLNHKNKIIKKYVNPIAYVSLASFADAFMKREGVYDKTYALSGSPRAFIQKANLGGRVMVNKNIPIKVDNDKKILDYDAVALYPSAMMTENTILVGKPKIITKDLIKRMNDEQIPILEDMTDTYIEYSINSVGEKLDFPIIYNRGKESIEYTNECTDMITSGRYLNEIVKYHKVKFTIKRGYYFNEGYNSRIKTVMRKLFNIRLQKKSEHNPIQILYKLIMNSSYGINGLKFMNNKFSLINVKQVRSFLYKNADIINYFTKISNDVNPAMTKYLFNLAKTRSSHFNRVHISASILDGSKIIMNRVFNSAKKSNCKIYYQDTDSIQTNAENIEIIERKFKELYPNKITLRGTMPGQFHPDYEINDCKNVIGKRAIYLAKKMYIVQLEGENINTGKIVKSDHIRMKGVSSEAIKSQLIEPWEAYKKIYYGEEIIFDLTAKLSLEKLDNFNIRKRSKFNRKVCLKPESINKLLENEDYRKIYSKK